MSSDRETIYVALLDEGIDVWRPVAARKLAPDTYLILDRNYDRKVETWQFEPGTLVRCRKKATKRPPDPGRDRDRPTDASGRYTEELITSRDARAAWQAQLIPNDIFGLALLSA